MKGISVTPVEVILFKNYPFFIIEYAIPRAEADKHYAKMNLDILTCDERAELEKDIRLCIWAGVFHPNRRLKKRNN